MTKKMLINALHKEECRVAVVDNGVLTDFNIERAGIEKIRGNIYKAVITRVEPSLQAVFVNIGASRNGFLPFKDIHPTYFRCPVPEGNPYRANINEAIKNGQELVVQVLRGERDSKGATLTTFLSIPGRYTVLLPGSDSRTISSKITDEKQRERFKAILAELDIPEGLGIIIRTAGDGRTKLDIKKDLVYVLRLWNEIKDKVNSAPTPSLLYEESDVPTTMLRDYFTQDIQEILVDDKDMCTEIKEFIKAMMPRYANRVKFYNQDTPLFAKYQIEAQVDEVNSPKVYLRSGGFIVIVQTEAMVTVDVNSGRFKACDDIEDTAYRINIEAANVIARHLKLRDLGGIVAVDFIDMRSPKHRANVEKDFKAAFKDDKAKTDFSKINQFGVLMMSRQRLGTNVEQQMYSITCPHCGGRGNIPSPETISLQIIRNVIRGASGANLATVNILVSEAVANYLLNHKRFDIGEIERKYSVRIVVKWDAGLSDGNSKVEFVNATEAKSPSDSQAVSGAAASGNGSTGSSGSSENGSGRGGAASRKYDTGLRRDPKPQSSGQRQPQAQHHPSTQGQQQRRPSTGQRRPQQGQAGNRPAGQQQQPVDSTQPTDQRSQTSNQRGRIQRGDSTSVPEEMKTAESTQISEAPLTHLADPVPGSDEQAATAASAKPRSRRGRRSSRGRGTKPAASQTGSAVPADSASPEGTGNQQSASSAGPVTSATAASDATKGSEAPRGDSDGPAGDASGTSRSRSGSRGRRRGPRKPAAKKAEPVE